MASIPVIQTCHKCWDRFAATRFLKHPVCPQCKGVGRNLPDAPDDASSRGGMCASEGSRKEFETFMGQGSKWRTHKDVEKTGRKNGFVPWSGKEPPKIDLEAKRREDGKKWQRDVLADYLKENRIEG